MINNKKKHIQEQEQTNTVHCFKELENNNNGTQHIAGTDTCQWIP